MICTIRKSLIFVLHDTQKDNFQPLIAQSLFLGPDVKIDPNFKGQIAPGDIQNAHLFSPVNKPTKFGTLERLPHYEKDQLDQHSTSFGETGWRSLEKASGVKVDISFPGVPSLVYTLEDLLALPWENDQGMVTLKNDIRIRLTDQGARHGEAYLLVEMLNGEKWSPINNIELYSHDSSSLSKPMIRAMLAAAACHHLKNANLPGTACVKEPNNFYPRMRPVRNVDDFCITDMNMQATVFLLDDRVALQEEAAQRHKHAPPYDPEKSIVDLTLHISKDQEGLKVLVGTSGSNAENHFVAGWEDDALKRIADLELAAIKRANSNLPKHWMNKRSDKVLDDDLPVDWLVAVDAIGDDPLDQLMTSAAAYLKRRDKEAMNEIANHPVTLTFIEDLKNAHVEVEAFVQKSKDEIVAFEREQAEKIANQPASSLRIVMEKQIKSEAARLQKNAASKSTIKPR